MTNPFQGGDIVSVVDARDLYGVEMLDANETYKVRHVTTYMVALEEKPGDAYHYSRFILEARPSHVDGDAEREHLHEGLNTLFVEEEPRSFPDAYYADYEASIGDNTPSPYPLSEMLDRLPADRREAVEARAEELVGQYVQLQREIDSDETAHELNRRPFPDAYYADYEASIGDVEDILEAADAAPFAVASDSVRQPHHYARYVIEPATFIAANKLPFDVGNVVKYVLRYDAKNGREDVLKATRYCEMLLERIDREARVAAGEDASTVWSVML